LREKAEIAESKNRFAVSQKTRALQIREKVENYRTDNLIGLNTAASNGSNGKCADLYPGRLTRYQPRQKPGKKSANFCSFYPHVHHGNQIYDVFFQKLRYITLTKRVYQDKLRHQPQNSRRSNRPPTLQPVPPITLLFLLHCFPEVVLLIKPAESES